MGFVIQEVLPVVKSPCNVLAGEVCRSEGGICLVERLREWLLRAFGVVLMTGG